MCTLPVTLACVLYRNKRKESFKSDCVLRGKQNALWDNKHNIQRDIFLAQDTSVPSILSCPWFNEEIKLNKKKHDYLIHGSVQWLNKRSSCTGQLHELKINCASLCESAEKIFSQSAYNQNLFLTSCKNIFLKNANKKREREISTMSKFLIDRGEKASVRFIKIMLPFIEFLGNVFLFFKTLQDRLR